MAEAFRPLGRLLCFRANRPTHGGSQSAIRERVFEKVERAGTYKFDRCREVGAASDYHDS
jgi:hypothetical protein